MYRGISPIIQARRYSVNSFRETWTYGFLSGSSFLGAIIGGISGGAAGYKLFSHDQDIDIITKRIENTNLLLAPIHWRSPWHRAR